MRVLQLCNKPPLPAVDGGCIAMNNITNGLLQEGVKVKLLTICTHKHDVDLDELPDKYLRQTKIEAVFVDTRVNLVDAFASLVTQDSYNVNRFFSTDFDIKLTRILTENEFDIIHLESLFMTPYIGTIRRLSNAKIVLRSHNLEYIIWERMAHGESFLPKRAYLKYLSKKLKEYELDVLDQVDGIAAISSDDMQRYRSLNQDIPIINIPFGIDMMNYPISNKPQELALFHLGSMDWSPNLEGMIWFLDEVWPKISAKYPDLKFYIAGRHIPTDILPENEKNIIIVGEVQNAKKFMLSKSIMVVPLLSAGGIRVKIIEGMALQKAVISTEIGAEGIQTTPGQDIFISNTPEEFLDALDHLIDQNELESIGKNARKLVQEQFDNQKITKQLIEFYQSLIHI